jgi:hypothetical protein
MTSIAEKSHREGNCTRRQYLAGIGQISRLRVRAISSGWRWRRVAEDAVSSELLSPWHSRISLVKEKQELSISGWLSRAVHAE